jgi:uncharacterized damage-inducible protein DinB
MAPNNIPLSEFDHEMAVTRKVLSRIPENKFGWAPHVKSMTLGRLATHLAEIPGWVKETLTLDGIDMGGDYKPEVLTTREQVVAKFDRMVAVARPLIESATDAQLSAPWTLKSDGQVMLTMPRFAVLRGFVLSHLIHHRAQMTVYLRLNDVPVPSIYGPSADEAS